jgi:hypothetical protein
MYIPKKYGQSKIDRCPFCNTQAFFRNRQGVPVCQNHKGSALKELKCACGEILTMRESKFGVFFACIKCGPRSLKKALEINEEIPGTRVQGKNSTTKSTKPKEIFIRSDDPEYFS